MSLLKLKSIFSPTNTKFEKSDLTTFPRQFDNDFQQTNLQNLDSIYDDGLNVPIKSNLQNFDSKFDDGLNVPTSRFKRFGETFQSQFDFNTIFDDNLSVPTAEFKRNGQRFQSQFNFNTIFDDGLGLPIFNNTIDTPPTTFQVQLSGGFRGSGVIEDFKSLYQDNQPIDKFDTRLNYNENIFHENSFTFSTDLTQRGGRDNPSLDTLLRGRVYQPIRFSQDFQNDNLFVKPETGEITEQLFKDQTFDPRAPFAKQGTLYFNTNKSFNQATNPTDFSTAIGNNDLPFTPITSLGGQFKEFLSWENLYEPNHTPKPSPKYKGVEAVSYGPNVSRDNLNIGSNQTIYGEKSGFRGFDRKSEPYIISKIGERDKYFNRLGNDVSRLSSFISSPQGLAFILRTNLNGENSKSVYFSKQGKLKTKGQRFKKRYNPVSTILSAGARAGFHSIANLDKTEPGLLGLSSLFGSDEYGDISILNPLDSTVPYNVNKSFTDGRTGGGFGFAKSLINTLTFQSGRDLTLKKDSAGGDDHTLTKLFKAGDLLPTPVATLAFDSENAFKVNHTIPFNIDGPEAGMPFYFKDLRDNTYIFFRAYIEGLTENVSPTYAPHNYIGRSEPVWTYERGEREISMTLKLVAQTKSELRHMYAKLDRLTSLCYPQYTSDDPNYSDPYGNRMKPPLTKLRYGELYGTTNNELMGYIKSLSYSVDQSSTYETGYPSPGNDIDDDIKEGQKEGRVPRHILATIGYQVIHSKTPRLSSDFDFYGYVGNKERDFEPGSLPGEPIPEINDPFSTV